MSEFIRLISEIERQLCKNGLDSFNIRVHFCGLQRRGLYILFFVCKSATSNIQIVNFIIKHLKKNPAIRFE